MLPAAPSPLVRVFDDLRTRDPRPARRARRPAGPGWIAGADLRAAGTGPFHALLLRIGECARTADRRTIAASFAMRFGWASGMAIAPYLRARCVPDVSLDNTSFKFAALDLLRACGDPRSARLGRGGRRSRDASAIATVADADALRRALRTALVDQAVDVVEALYQWSGFARRGTWGMLTSAWASQFTAIAEPRDDQRGARAGARRVLRRGRHRRRDAAADARRQRRRRHAPVSAPRQLLPPVSPARRRTVRELPARRRRRAPGAQPRLDAEPDGPALAAAGDRLTPRRQKLFLAIFSCAPGTSISAAIRRTGPAIISPLAMTGSVATSRLASSISPTARTKGRATCRRRRRGRRAPACPPSRAARCSPCGRGTSRRAPPRPAPSSAGFRMTST